MPSVIDTVHAHPFNQNNFFSSHLPTSTKNLRCLAEVKNEDRAAGLGSTISKTKHIPEFAQTPSAAVSKRFECTE